MSGRAVSAPGHKDARGQRLKARALDEIRRFLTLFVYLWILFGLFVLNERIILREHGINFAAQGFAFFNALVLAKVMLVAEDLNLAHWLNKRPLIYPILHDSLVFTVLFIAFHVAEKVVIGMFAGGSFASSVPSIGGGGVVGLLCVAVIGFFGLIPFFAFSNVSRVLGPGFIRELLFGFPPSSPVAVIPLKPFVDTSMTGNRMKD